MKMMGLVAVASVALLGSAGAASADPDKDESGKGRWRGGYERFERDDDRPRRRSYGAYGYDGPRERRAFKEEYDDGTCKYERKLEKSGEYKEEVKCRGGRRGAYRY